MEGFHLAHGQVSLQKDRTFHLKVSNKLYGKSNLNFLNFTFALSTSKKVYGGSNLGTGCLMLF